ncbi:MAG: hypothetical protein RLZZ165_1604 [Bacteroidota bacterium]
MPFPAFIRSLRIRPRPFILLGAFTLALKLIASNVPSIVEQVYSRGLFVGIRYTLDYTIGWCPFPFSYVFVFALVAWWGIRWWRIRRTAIRPWHDRLKLASLNVGGFIGAGVFFFHVLWGFNYVRVPVEEHLGLRLDSLDVEALCMEAEWSARLAERDRAMIPGITSDSISKDLLPDDLEAEVRACVGKCMGLMNYPMHGRIRGRIISPGGWMLRVGIAGIYNPFTGEGNVTAAQTPQKIPYTMAHEMAHACGFGDEGTCNFIAMVACGLSDDPFIRYSGQMGYWGQVIHHIAEVDPSLSKMLIATMDPGVQADLRASYYNYLKYSGVFSRVGQGVNNAYLNAQGVRGGILNYDRAVGLRASWRRQTGS